MHVVYILQNAWELLYLSRIPCGKKPIIGDVPALTSSLHRPQIR